MDLPKSLKKSIPFTRNVVAEKLEELSAPTPSKDWTHLFNPSLTTLKTTYEQFLSNGIKEGTIAVKWIEDFRAAKLSLDDAFALKVIEGQREKK